METMSSLEKINNLKLRVRAKREDEARAAERRAAETETEIAASYESENEALGAMAARRDEITARLAANKVARDEIVAVGRAGVASAYEDPDVKAELLKDGGLRDLFADERAGLQSLRTEAAELNEELETLVPAIAEKEARVAELYAETKEGKEARRAELGARLVNPRYVDLSDFGRGIPNPGLFKVREIVALDEDARPEAIAAAKDAARSCIEDCFKKENERNGLRDIGEDLARAGEFQREKKEVVSALQEYRRYANDLLVRYENFFNEHPDVDSVVAGNLGTGNNERRNAEFAYLRSGHREAFGPQKLLEIEESLRANGVTEGTPVPDLGPIREYLSTARAFNEGLLSALEAGGVEKAREIFWRGIDYGDWARKELNLSLYSAGEKLVRNVPKSLVTSAASVEWKRGHSGSLKDYYENETVRQAAKAGAYADLASAFLDEQMEVERAGGRDAVSAMEKEEEEIRSKRDAVRFHYLPALESAERNFADRLGEKIFFQIDNWGTPLELAIPKFEDEVGQIKEYAEKIDRFKEDIARIEKELGALENKKVGFLESQKKHDNAVIMKKGELRDLKSSRDTAVSNRAYFVKRKDDQLVSLFTREHGLDVAKEAGLSGSLTLGEALLRIKNRLLSLAETSLSPQKALGLEACRAARKKMAAAKDVAVRVSGH